MSEEHIEDAAGAERPSAPKGETKSHKARYPWGKATPERRLEQVVRAEAAIAKELEDLEKDYQEKRKALAARRQAMARARAEVQQVLEGRAKLELRRKFEDVYDHLVRCGVDIRIFEHPDLTSKLVEFATSMSPPPAGAANEGEPSAEAASAEQASPADGKEGGRGRRKKDAAPDAPGASDAGIEPSVSDNAAAA